MKIKIFLLFILAIFLFIFTLETAVNDKDTTVTSVNSEKERYWLLLHRKSNKEFLYFGIPGEANNSRLLKTFQVKSGVSDKSPTPLPNLIGRKYWLIINKEESFDNPETAPYFLTLDVPASEDPPYGPVSYSECDGKCDWVLPGYFGLHGVNGDELKLSKEDPGSSGCIRHKDSDIEYLYNNLDPVNTEIRYYIQDI